MLPRQPCVRLLYGSRCSCYSFTVSTCVHFTCPLMASRGMRFSQVLRQPAVALRRIKYGVSIIALVLVSHLYEYEFPYRGYGQGVLVLVLLQWYGRTQHDGI